MTKPIQVTIPVTFTVKELLAEWGTKWVNRKKFYEIAQSPRFKREMSRLLREDYDSMGGLDDLDLFEDAMSEECLK
jgi:hypothetical protein